MQNEGESLLVLFLLKNKLAIPEYSRLNKSRSVKCETVTESRISRMGNGFKFQELKLNISKYSDAKHGKFIFQSNHLDLVADQFSAESKYTLRDRAAFA